mgnify:CR=1 FL=1|tara:strand:- start:946 stop:1146 length:201 start_codon:yes stop_codon:yes gene_type:complete
MHNFLYSVAAGFLGALSYIVTTEVQRAEVQKERQKKIQRLRALKRQEQEGASPEGNRREDTRSPLQ